MNKKNRIIIISLIVVVLITIFSLITYYNYSLKGSNDNTKVTLVISEGMYSKQIVDEIYNAGLIKNKYSGYIYLKLHKNINLQAGVYEVNKNMSFKEIINRINNGDVVRNEVSVTFIEGKRLSTYIKQISEAFPFEEKEIETLLSDKEYLNKLIDKYWFLTDEILQKDIYYPLEGYLAPNTYYFDKNSSIENIIEKMLDASKVILDKYKDNIENSKYSVHELLSMASIIELEAVTEEDRQTVSQVIYKRLNIGMTLGMDVTTYYAVKKDMSEELWYKDLNVNNPYNTRVVSGLPIGPICNVSTSAFAAVFNPKDTDYLYFYADVKTGKVYFAKNETEFYELIRKYS